jgi:hypothetical protein
MVEMENPVDESGIEHTYASKIKEIKGPIFLESIIPKMRISVENACFVKRIVPGIKEIFSHKVPVFKRRVYPGHEGLTLKILHGEETLGGELWNALRDMDFWFVMEKGFKGFEGRKLTKIREFFSKTVSDFLQDLFCIQGTTIKSEEKLELRQVSLHCGGHIRILEFAGKEASLKICGPMYLA